MNCAATPAESQPPVASPPEGCRASGAEAEAVIKAERLLHRLRDQLGYLRWFMAEIADQEQFAKLAIYAGDGTFGVQDGARREASAISRSCKEIEQTIPEIMAAIGKFRGPCPICEGRTWLDEPTPPGRMQWDCRGHDSAEGHSR